MKTSDQVEIPHDDATVDAPSVAIERLIEEIRRDSVGGNPNAYNRTYSRHNRS